MIGTHVGKYEILERIGRGSMGTVYRARDNSLHRDVAIKTLNPDLNDPAAGRRFRAEAIAIARLNDPGIAKVYDLFEHDGQWLMAMELVQGETLESLVARGGPLSAERAAELVSQALRALTHAHGMGVIHRDLKPANLMLAGGRLKITDFGIARVAGTEHLTSDGLRMGTPAYMAPEQILGHEIDARTDVFAMGCVMFFIAAGALPFRGDTPMDLVQSRLQADATPIRTIRHELPDWFAGIVACALARDPRSRFQTADAFHRAIQRGLAGLPIDLPQAPDVMETMRPGTMAAKPPVSAASAGQPVAVAETVKVAATPAATQPEKPRDTAEARRPALSRALPIAAVVVIIGGILTAMKYWPGSPSAPAASAPAATSAPPPAPGSESSERQTPVASAAPPATTASPTPPAVTVAPAETATGTPPAGASRGTEAPLSFGSAKWLRVTGSKGDDVEATLTVGGTSIVVAPRPKGAPLVMSYKSLAAATFVQDRAPKWAPNLPAPPADLDLSRSVPFLRPPVRNWLVLQSRSSFLVLALPDGDADKILRAIEARAHLKVAR
ncbi:MAG TPA: serine/threonine-protein kinase [Vicinamibacterales bacterium]|nr:serine/threonine-protein kinase [Vicinamibacterales bacterium]